MNKYEENIVKSRHKKIYIIIIGIYIIMWLIAYNYKPPTYVPIEGEIIDYQHKRHHRGLYKVTDIEYVINGKKILLKEVDEYKLGWKRGDKVTIYVDPDNQFHIYSNRNYRILIWIYCYVTCFIAGRIIVEREKYRRRTNPNWFEEDREKYGDE